MTQSVTSNQHHVQRHEENTFAYDYDLTFLSCDLNSSQAIPNVQQSRYISTPEKKPALKKFVHVFIQPGETGSPFKKAERNLERTQGQRFRLHSRDNNIKSSNRSNNLSRQFLANEGRFFDKLASTSLAESRFLNQKERTAVQIEKSPHFPKQCKLSDIESQERATEDLALNTTYHLFHEVPLEDNEEEQICFNPVYARNSSVSVDGSASGSSLYEISSVNRRSGASDSSHSDEMYTCWQRFVRPTDHLHQQDDTEKKNGDGSHRNGGNCLTLSGGRNAWSPLTSLPSTPLSFPPPPPPLTVFQFSPTLASPIPVPTPSPLPQKPGDKRLRKSNSAEAEVTASPSLSGDVDALKSEMPVHLTGRGISYPTTSLSSDDSSVFSEKNKSQNANSFQTPKNVHPTPTSMPISKPEQDSKRRSRRHFSLLFVSLLFPASVVFGVILILGSAWQRLGQDSSAVDNLPVVMVIDTDLSKTLPTVPPREANGLSVQNQRSKHGDDGKMSNLVASGPSMQDQQSEHDEDGRLSNLVASGPSKQDQQSEHDEDGGMSNRISRQQSEHDKDGRMSNIISKQQSEHDTDRRLSNPISSQQPEHVEDGRMSNPVASGLSMQDQQSEHGKDARMSTIISKQRPEQAQIKEAIRPSVDDLLLPDNKDGARSEPPNTQPPGRVEANGAVGPSVKAVLLRGKEAGTRSEPLSNQPPEHVETKDGNDPSVQDLHLDKEDGRGSEPQTAGQVKA